MKNIFLLSFVVLFSAQLTAQTFNQFNENGKRHGVWRKYFEGTKVLRYEGAFSNGKEIGLFKFYKHIDGKAVLSATRQFNDSTNMAEVTFFSSKGKVISKGHMRGRIYIGTWKYYQKDSDALLTLEHYNDSGQLNGKRIVYYPNGQVAEQTFYQNDALHANAYNYALNGTLLKSLVYNQGELHGTAKFYTPDGKLIVEGQYQNDKKIGKWKYYENDTLKEIKTF